MHGALHKTHTVYLVRLHLGLIHIGRKRMRKALFSLEFVGYVTFVFVVAWCEISHIWGSKARCIFCFTRNLKNSIIIKSLHHYKLHVTSLFTRILLDLSCVSRRSSFQRIARGALYNRMSTNLPQNLSKKVMLLHWKHDEFFKDVPKYEAFHFKPSSWIQLR